MGHDMKIEWGVPVPHQALPRAVRAAEHTWQPSLSFWRLPAQWDRKAREAGVRERVFFSPMADVFERRADLVEPRRRAFEIIDTCTNLDFMMLTKRPQNIRRMWPVKDCVKGARRNNVWLLTSVSDQATADEMVPRLLKCRDLVPVLGLSCEPLLGPVDLWQWIAPKVCGCRGNRDCECFPGKSLLDWIICGGARPCALECDIRRQCEEVEVPCWNECPADLRVRQMPEVLHG